MGTELIYAAIILIVAVAISTASKVQTTSQQEAGSLDVPTADEGEPLSVVFGTCLVKKGNTIFYGDGATEEIRSSGGGKK